MPPQELAAKAVAQRGPVEALMSAMRADAGGHGKAQEKRMLARIGVEDIQEATARLMRAKAGARRCWTAALRAMKSGGSCGTGRKWREARPARGNTPGQRVAVQYAAEQARGRHGQLSRAGGAAPVPGR